MNLLEIFKKYKTDKCIYHDYHIPYEENFEFMRNDNIKLLEIGVRDCNSLRSWKEYFSNGSIYGMDIDPSCEKFEKEGFNIIIGDQGNEEDLRKFGDIKFDIIIDDGSHFTEHMISTFKFMFDNYLNPGGVYAIEDLGCSYIRQYGSTTSTMSNPKGQSKNNLQINNRQDIVELIESIHNNMDIHNWTKGREGYNLTGPVKKQYQRFVSYTDIFFVHKTL